MTLFKELCIFYHSVLENRKLLVSLSISNFKEQYLGSYFGALWSIVRPLLFIVAIWFIFSVGFKSKPVNNETPFMLWLLCGIVPWIFFSEVLVKSTKSVVKNAFLAKKPTFEMNMLPLVEVLSSLCVHIVFIVILLIIFLFFEQSPNIYWIQIPYFALCMSLLLLGVGWLTASIRVFVKDTDEIIGTVVQFGFWLTPIFWSINILPEKYQSIVKLNPVFYIVDGYRGALIYQKWFWEDINLTLYFFMITAVILILGSIVFSRLKIHFGDVL